MKKHLIVLSWIGLSVLGTAVQAKPTGLVYSVPMYNAGPGGGAMPLAPVPIRLSMGAPGRKGIVTPLGAVVTVLIGKGGSKTEFAEFRPGFKPEKYGFKTFGDPVTFGDWHGYRFSSKKKKGGFQDGYDLIRDPDGMSLRIDAKTMAELEEGRRLVKEIALRIPKRL